MCHTHTHTRLDALAGALSAIRTFFTAALSQRNAFIILDSLLLEHFQHKWTAHTHEQQSRTRDCLICVVFTVQSLTLCTILRKVHSHRITTAIDMGFLVLVWFIGHFENISGFPIEWLGWCRLSCKGKKFLSKHIRMWKSRMSHIRKYDSFEWRKKVTSRFVLDKWFTFIFARTCRCVTLSQPCVHECEWIEYSAHQIHFHTVHAQNERRTLLFHSACAARYASLLFFPPSLIICRICMYLFIYGIATYCHIIIITWKSITHIVFRFQHRGRHQFHFASPQRSIYN